MTASKFVILITAMALCANCASPSSPGKEKYDALCSYIGKLDSTVNLEDYTKIFLLTDDGCTTCNSAFARFLTTQLADSNSLVLIAADGSRIDISAFSEKNGRTLWDGSDRLGQIEGIRGTGAILLGTYSVDTVISINAAELESQLAYLSNWKALR